MTKKLIMILGLVLSSMLMKAQAFFVPFPKAGDKYWQKQVPVAMRNDYIRLGNLYQKKPWNAIPAETFAEFRTNGNRTRYEEASFGIRKQFVCLVMAEIMQGRGRFLPSSRRAGRTMSTTGIPELPPTGCRLCSSASRMPSSAMQPSKECSSACEPL